MSKISKVSYKAILLTRLKQVDFHGKLTPPLYLQVTYKRIPHPFKSYYFDLLTKGKYNIHAGTARKAPSLNKVIKKEEEVLEFIISELGDNFSLAQFKKKYNYYSADLCDLTETPFKAFLKIHLADKGLPTLALCLEEGSQNLAAYDILDDIKMIHPPFYQELIKASISYGQPYLALYGFARSTRKWPYILSVMEWERSETQRKFGVYFQQHFPSQDLEQMLLQITLFISKFNE